MIVGFTAVTATLAAPAASWHPTMPIRQRAIVSTSFNVMFEALYVRTDVARPSTVSGESLLLNPGVRGAINVAGGLQIVPGVSVPIGVGPSRGERGVLFYLSFEHPFRLAGPTEDGT